MLYPPPKQARSPRGPSFGREQWLARNEARRTGEWTSNHMQTLQAISPRLMHHFRQGRLGLREFEEAVAVNKRGGQEYTAWAEKNIRRRDPCFNPYTGKYSNPPTFNVSFRPPGSSPRRIASPRQLTPLHQLPPAPAMPKQDVPWFMLEPEDAPMGGDGHHVDHSLEMWRNGEGMGGGGGYVAGYRFDGDVAAVGKGLFFV